MNKIIKCTIFILIFVIMLAVLSKIFIPKNNILAEKLEEKYAEGILAEPADTVDMLVVGDSESYTSYIPLEIWNKYGYTSYVCGTPRQTLPYTLSYIERAKQKQNLKAVMIETNTFYTKVDISVPLKKSIEKVLPIFKYHDRWKNLNENDFFGEINYTNLQVNKGYYYSDKIKKIKKNKNYMKKTETEKRIPNLNRRYIKKIKNYCDKNDIKLIFYSSPSSTNWNYSKHLAVTRLAQILDIDFVDLNTKTKEMHIDWKKDTRDNGDHLNHYGALKATQFLGEYLNSKNILEDHKNDEKYSSWNEDYKHYLKEVQK